MTTPRAVPVAAATSSELDLTAAVANVMTKVASDRDEERVAAQPKRPSRRNSLVAAVLFAVFLGTTTNALSSPVSGASISPAAEARAARFQLWLASRNVDAFYDSAGVWPESVGAIGVDTGTVAYSRTVSGYVLAVQTAGKTWSHASGDAKSKAELNATADSVIQGGVR